MSKKPRHVVPTTFSDDMSRMSGLNTVKAEILASAKSGAKLFSTPHLHLLIGASIQILPSCDGLSGA